MIGQLAGGVRANVFFVVMVDADMSLAPSRRPPDVPAVHAGDDGCSEDLPLAVHRVQMLQRLWHVRERCEPRSHVSSKCANQCRKCVQFCLYLPY